jgi:YegS/Rv2252/BmrU family lipid kinase
MLLNSFIQQICLLKLKYMKALFFYSECTGRGHILKKIDYIVLRLNKIFSHVDVIKALSFEHLVEIVNKACDDYDYIIFAGGDGTFNDVVNILMKHEKKPILGYIPGGTINDVSKNFGIPNNIRRALNIIENGHVVDFDVVKINEKYFDYVAAIGSFADIAYVTKRTRKKRLGKIAYYNKAVQETMMPKTVIADIKIDDKVIDAKVPFILILNGRNVGGFLVNSKSNNRDGYLDLFLTKPGLFNGLLHYLFFKVKTTHYKAKHLEIKTNQKMPWCIDGEQGPVGDVVLDVVPLALKIFAKNNI